MCGDLVNVVVAVGCVLCSGLEGVCVDVYGVVL